MAKRNSKNTANLTPWKPGQSGNPSGVSKAVRRFHDDFKGELIRQLSGPAKRDQAKKRTRLQAIVGRLLDAAEGGEIAAVREILDRLMGKPKQEMSVEIESTGLRQAFERMTSAELLDYAEAGKLPEWFEREATNGTQVQ